MRAEILSSLGRVKVGEVVIPPYPKLLHLAELKAPMFAQQKINGYNVRVAKVGKDWAAFLRGGLIDEKTNALLKENLGRNLERFFRVYPNLVLVMEVIGCYSDDTEILTEKGFKYFKDLSYEDKVATLKAGNLVFEKPLDIVSYDYDGDIYEICTRTINLVITPEHKIYSRSFTKKSNYELNVIADLYEKAQKSNHKRKWIGMKSTSNWEGEEVDYFWLPSIKNVKYDGHNHSKKKIKMDDWLEFMGYFLADGYTSSGELKHQNGNKRGHYYTVGITKKKQKDKNKIRKLIKRLPFAFCETKTGFQTGNKQLWMYLKQFGKAKNKYIPYELKQLSKRQLKILLDALIFCDGHINKTGQIHYYTISKQLADDVCELILKVGGSPSVYVQNKINWSKMETYKLYCVSMKKIKEHYIDLKKHVGVYKYQGKVYCCQVPSGVIYVRRNGRCCWSGNSKTMANYKGDKDFDYFVFDIMNLNRPEKTRFLNAEVVENLCKTFDLKFIGNLGLFDDLEELKKEMKKLPDYCEGVVLKSLDGNTILKYKWEDSPKDFKDKIKKAAVKVKELKPEYVVFDHFMQGYAEPELGLKAGFSDKEFKEYLNLIEKAGIGNKEDIAKKVNRVVNWIVEKLSAKGDFDDKMLQKLEKVARKRITKEIWKKLKK